MTFFGVFKDESIVHLTEDENEAIVKFRELEGDKLRRVDDLQELSSALSEDSQGTTAVFNIDDYMESVSDEMSEAAESLIAKLNSMGFNSDNVQKFKDSGKHIVAEAKGLGVKGISALNDQIKMLSTQVDHLIASIEKEEEETSDQE